MKKCSKCLQEKPLTEFRIAPRYRGGRRSYCNSCKNEMNNTWQRKRSLERKSICKLDGCNAKVGFRRKSFCSIEHMRKAMNLITWQKQKNDPNYKERHRKIAREWARKRRAKEKQLAL